MADKANFFLEINTGTSGINVGVANQRDVLSHLVSFLGGKDQENSLDIDGQKSQYLDSGEHFRRAIFEPYEYAVNMRMEELIDKLTNFKKYYTYFPFSRWVIGIKEKDIVSIENKITMINKIRRDARTSKRLNMWTNEWEKGVQNNIYVFNEANNLKNEVDGYFRTIISPLVSIITGLIFMGVGFLITIVFF